MKRSLPYLGLLALVLVTFSSCSKKPDAPIPANAAIVLHINGESLSEKLPWSELKESQWFKMAAEEADGDSLGKVLMNDPGQSGIDIKSDAWVYVANRGKGAYSAFSCKLSDAKKFESLIKNASTDVKIQQKESISYIGEGSVLVSWNNSRLLVLGDASDFNKALNGQENEYDEYSDTQSSEGYGTDSLLAIAQELYALKSSNQLGNNDKFADLIKTKGDVHFWVNAGSMYGNTLAGSLLSFSKLSTLLEGNIATGTIAFNDGTIQIDSKSYVGKELEALYKKYQSSNFDTDMLKNLPAGEVNLAMGMNYPPDGLKAFLSLLGVDGLVNTFMQEAGFSVDEFIKANTGNLFFALSDFKIAKEEKTIDGFGDEPYTYTTTEPSGKLLFGTEINERTAFQKMMDVAKQLLIDKGGMDDEALSKIPYQIKDKWFLSGNDSNQLQDYGSKKTDHSFIDLIKGHPIGMYVNIVSFIKGSMAEIGDEPMTKNIAELSIKFWKDIILTGGEFEDGASVSHLSLRLGDEKTNSLKSLNQYVGKIAKMAQEDEDRRRAEWETEYPAVVDSVAVPLD